MLVTGDATLQGSLHEDLRGIVENSEQVSDTTLQDPQRHVKLWEKAVTSVVRSFF